jgi:hypothetical protein
MIQKHKFFGVHLNYGSNKIIYSNAYSTPDEYILTNDIYNIPLSEFEKHKTNQISSTDKVYFTKSSTIPRYKLKEYCDNNSLEIDKTNRKEYADVYVVGLNLIKELIYDKSNYIQYYQIPIHDLDILDRSTKAELKRHGWAGGDVLFKKEDDLQKRLKNSNSSILLDKYPIITLLPIYKHHGSGKVNDVIDTFIYLTDRLNTHKLVFDETLISLCNADFFIDNEIYNNLCNMLSSEDKENNKLALEIMCNSNYESSKVYLLLLFNEFANKINKEKTPNTQYLLNYFSKYYNIMNTNWEVFVNKMFGDYSKDENATSIIKDYIIKRLNEQFKNNYTNFSIKNIDLNI